MRMSPLTLLCVGLFAVTPAGSEVLDAETSSVHTRRRSCQSKSRPSLDTRSTEGGCYVTVTS